MIHVRRKRPKPPATTEDAIKQERREVRRSVGCVRGFGAALNGIACDPAISIKICAKDNCYVILHLDTGTMACSAYDYTVPMVLRRDR